MKYAFKNEISSFELKEFRINHNLTRIQMADFLNVSVRSLERYETKDSRLKGSIVTLYRLLNEYPELLERFEMPNKTYPLRMYYMEKGNINTVIDVDMSNRKVRFKNFTNNIIARAFGNKETVTYEEYEAFLESRCFPKTRDKMKMQLDIINVPVYDPLLIIEKTKGKMAEDDFYIEIERGE